MMRIAYIIEKFVDIPVGGEPAIHINLIEHLISIGCYVDVFFEVGLITKTETKYVKHPDFLKNKKEYLKRINKSNYDLIISSRFGLKFSNLKADMYTIHSHSDYFSQKSKFGMLYNILKPKQKKIINEINNLKLNKDKFFIFCSNQLKEDYCSLCDLKNTKIIYPYPNCTPIAQKERNKNEVFTFGISAIGFENKGGYLILKSAFLLNLLNYKFKLKIIYRKNPAFLPKLLTLLTGLNNKVEFLDKQQDMHNFFESVDCIIMASKLESFGITAIEGIGYGLPVIVSSNCGVKELMEGNKTGFIFSFNRNKVWNLFKKMKYVLDNRNQEYSRIDTNTKDSYNNSFEEIIKNEITKKECKKNNK